ncbi:unnamed protein product [Chironomus riparius]|uniref:Uncharacterized protein n=1 Tax=Chironomus riparius TaxID=315576 RepID=A0A9N9S769_9DIPT|nr:unnamed protein product [Chironomus riparius]
MIITIAFLVLCTLVGSVKDAPIEETRKEYSWKGPEIITFVVSSAENTSVELENGYTNSGTHESNSSCSDFNEKFDEKHCEHIRNNQDDLKNNCGQKNNNTDHTGNNVLVRNNLTDGNEIVTQLNESQEFVCQKSCPSGFIVKGFCLDKQEDEICLIKRCFNDGQPQNNFNDGPPQNNFNDGPPQNNFNDGPPQNNFNDGPPQNNFNDGSPQNYFNDVINVALSVALIVAVIDAVIFLVKKCSQKSMKTETQMSSNQTPNHQISGVNETSQNDPTIITDPETQAAENTAFLPRNQLYTDADDQKRENGISVTISGNSEGPETQAANTDADVSFTYDEQKAHSLTVIHKNYPHDFILRESYNAFLKNIWKKLPPYIKCIIKVDFGYAIFKPINMKSYNWFKDSLEKNLGDMQLNVVPTADVKPIIFVITIKKSGFSIEDDKIVPRILKSHEKYFDCQKSFMQLVSDQKSENEDKEIEICPVNFKILKDELNFKLVIEGVDYITRMK